MSSYGIALYTFYNLTHILFEVL